MKMRSVDFYDTALNNCSFEYMDLRFSDYRDSILEKVSFKGADLRSVLFSDKEYEVHNAYAISGFRLRTYS